MNIVIALCGYSYHHGFKSLMNNFPVYDVEHVMASSVHTFHDVCTCVCAHVDVGECVSKRDETGSDLIQLKTNTQFCLQTLSWKQAGFPGYQREGHIQAIDRQRKMNVDKRDKKGQDIKDWK